MSVLKIITSENYYLPDETIESFGFLERKTGEQRPITEEDMINLASNLTLNEYVPNEINEMFEASKALYMYGYLYWTFLTLAQEQSFKAFEATIAKTHEIVFGNNYSPNGKKRLQLSDMINCLVKFGIIPEEKERKYWAIRNFRNQSFHPSMQSQWGN